MKINGGGLAGVALACFVSYGIVSSPRSLAAAETSPPGNLLTQAPATGEKPAPKVAEDPNRAKRERLGQIARELFGMRKQLQSTPGQPPDPATRQKFEALMAESGRLLTEVVGEDQAKQGEYMEGVIQEFLPEEWDRLKGQKLAAQQTVATATLKNIVMAEEVLRMDDADGNQKPDYWVADLSGLNRIRRSDQDAKGVELIPRDVALADARPCVPLDKEGRFEGKAGTAPVLMVAVGSGKAKSGYLFVALESCEVEVGRWKPYHDGSGRSDARYGFCAYPERYGVSGNQTFIVSEAGTVYKKDTGGKPPVGYPMDPVAAGWTPAER